MCEYARAPAGRVPPRLERVDSRDICAEIEMLPEPRLHQTNSRQSVTLADVNLLCEPQLTSKQFTSIYIITETCKTAC